MDSYEDIISIENLLEAWLEFVKGKRGRVDVQSFERNLMSHVIALHHDLSTHTYIHDGYDYFHISDPKARDIHKASVRDRLLHHAIYRKLYPFFERTFISDSYSCQKGKGTHRAIAKFEQYARMESKNYTRTVWVLKCDIRKFFASIDQRILMELLHSYIPDEEVLWLIGQVIISFSSTEIGKGLPLGNLTSQLLVNVYMNELDQFVKHKLKAKFYIRYADDFAFLSYDRAQLESLLSLTEDFLQNRLKLELHPNKVSIITLASGVDFLGWVHFLGYRVLRTITKRRMLRSLKEDPRPEVAASYLGLLGHGNTGRLQQKINQITQNQQSHSPHISVD